MKINNRFKIEYDDKQKQPFVEYTNDNNNVFFNQRKSYKNNVSNQIQSIKQKYFMLEYLKRKELEKRKEFIIEEEVINNVIEEENIINLIGIEENIQLPIIFLNEKDNNNDNNNDINDKLDTNNINENINYIEYNNKKVDDSENVTWYQIDNNSTWY